MAVPVVGVVHVNVGLVPLTLTNPLPQDGAGFGLSGRVQWDVHLLHDARGLLGPAVDLLEWKRPLPAGKPAAETSAPVWLEMGPEVPIAGLWAVFFRDPDGTCLELIQRPELRPGA